MIEMLLLLLLLLLLYAHLHVFRFVITMIVEMTFMKPSWVP